MIDGGSPLLAVEEFGLPVAMPNSAVQPNIQRFLLFIPESLGSSFFHTVSGSVIEE
jgi:hypothetical protein